MTNAITQWNRMASANAVERLVAERTKTDKVDAQAAKAESARAAAPEQDRLELSALARQQPAATADFDRAKVDAIKQALQDGQYPLNARKIAENFMALEKMISE